MNFKNWFIIRDDHKRTFEVVTQSLSENAFTNKVIAMQREGMQVTSVVLPVTNKNASKEHIKFLDYIQEDGLYERLSKQHLQLIQKGFAEFE